MRTRTRRFGEKFCKQNVVAGTQVPPTTENKANKLLQRQGSESTVLLQESCPLTLECLQYVHSLVAMAHMRARTHKHTHTNPD